MPRLPGRGMHREVSYAYAMLMFGAHGSRFKLPAEKNVHGKNCSPTTKLFIELLGLLDQA